MKSLLWKLPEWSEGFKGILRNWRRKDKRFRSLRSAEAWLCDYVVMIVIIMVVEMMVVMVMVKELVMVEKMMVGGVACIEQQRVTLSAKSKSGYRPTIFPSYTWTDPDVDHMLHRGALRRVFRGGASSLKMWLIIWVLSRSLDLGEVISFLVCSLTSGQYRDRPVFLYSQLFNKMLSSFHMLCCIRPLWPLGRCHCTLKAKDLEPYYDKI